MKKVLALTLVFLLIFGCVTQHSESNSIDSNKLNFIGPDENTVDSNSNNYSNLDLFKKAKIGDLVFVHYTGKLETGETFDSSQGKDPLKITIGTTPLISGFEKALIGMKIGEKKVVTILPKEGYGEIIYLDANMFRGTDELKEGMVFNNGDSEIKIMSVDGNVIGITNNHKLAGKTLIFEIEMISNN